MTKLEDFLCRRFKISLVSRQDTIKNSAGLLEACDILFGAEAKMRFDEYFREHPVVVVGIAKNPSSGQAAADDAPDAREAADTSREREGAFETLNW